LALSEQVTGPIFAAERNWHLRNWWQWLFVAPTELIRAIEALREEYGDTGSDRDVFNALRDGYNAGRSDTLGAAAHLWVLIYASTNNLARFNQQGDYNQTWGKGRVVPDPRTVITAETLRAVARVGHRTRLCRDYRAALDDYLDYLDDGGTGICYLDPPYILEAGMYDANQWSAADLGQLMDYIEGLEERGAWWLYTDYMRKGGREHQYLQALQRFRCVPIGSTRDARPNGAATDKQEVLAVGSGAAERVPVQGTLEAGG
jgi:site-specific DNA-adenine methylase